MKKFFKLPFLGFVALVLCSCATNNRYALEGAHVPEGSYSDAIDRWSGETKIYSGFVAAMQVVVILNAIPIIEHQVYKQADDAHLTTEKYRENLNKALQEAKSQTTILVGLYTEKDESNDLDSKKTLWNVFLDVGGKRISPLSIKKISENSLFLMSKYPLLNNWTKPYLVTFPIGTEEVTSQKTEFVLAGPPGTAHFTFPKP